MRLSPTLVIIFFAVIALAAGLLFPTALDVVTIYRNSYLYGRALEQLDALGEQRQGDPRVDLARAHVLYLAGRYDSAIDVLAGVTVYDAENRDAWWQLAEVYRTVQLPEKAIVALEQVVVIAPADSQALYLLDDYYRWFQRTDQAVANLEAIISHYPTDYDSYENLVNLHMRTGRSEAATQVLRRMAAAFPDRGGALEDLADVYLAQSDKRAVALYAELYQGQPERDDLAENLLRALVMTGDGAGALELLANHYESRLAPGPYQARRGRLLVELSDNPAAIEAYERAQALAPADAQLEALMELYGAVGDMGRAARAAESLATRWPDNARYWERWADYLAAAEDKQGLLVTLQGYLDRWPDDADAWLELADAHQWIEDYAGELNSLERCLLLRPMDTLTRRRQAGVLANLGRHRESARQYEQLLTASPDCGACFEGLLLTSAEQSTDVVSTRQAKLLWNTQAGHHRAGLLYARRLDDAGQGGRAQEVYDRLARGTSDPGLLAAIGQRLLDAGRPVAARPYLESALRQAPQDAKVLSASAALYAVDAPSQALVLLHRLAAQHPSDADIAYRIGLAYESLRDTVAMVGAYRQTLDLAPRHDGTIYGLRRQAHAMRRSGQEAEALQLLTTAMSMHPGDLSLINDHAEMLIARGDYEAALSSLSRVPTP